MLLIFLCGIAVNNIPILWSCGDSNCTVCGVSDFKPMILGEKK